MSHYLSKLNVRDELKYIAFSLAWAIVFTYSLLAICYLAKNTTFNSYPHTHAERFHKQRDTIYSIHDTTKQKPFFFWKVKVKGAEMLY